MTEKGMSGIEKLREYAKTKNRWTEDKLTGDVMQVWYGRYTTGEEFDALADQIERELQHAVDAAVKEAEAELDKRLMPEGLEWPRFEDGKPIARRDAPDGIAAVMIMLDGSGYELIDMPDYAVRPRGERVKRPEPKVLAADGLPINIGDTVYGSGREQSVYTVVSPRAGEGRFSIECTDRDGELCMVDASLVAHTPPDTQERIDEDVCKITDGCTYFSSDGSCIKCRFVSQYGDADSAYAACPGGDELERMVVSDLLRRQRELDARTMGGAE